MAQHKVLILMGSDSDFEVMKKASAVLSELGIDSDVRVLSVHRVPEVALPLAKEAEALGYGAIIGGAGMAAHLSGAVAGHTVLPVIGVPLESGPLKGVDALYSTVQMPPGVPVGTMAINGARNAGIFAAQILATADPELRDRLRAFKQDMSEKVLEKDRKIQAQLQES